MAKKNTSIEINGRRYDALNGQLLATPGAPRSIDGVVATTRAQIVTPATVVPTIVPPAATLKPTMDIRAPRTAAAHARTHKPKPAATLMRAAVHKPAPPLKRHVKAQTSTLALAPRASAELIKPKASLYHIEPRRQARAASVALSPKVSHFTSQASAATSTKPLKASVHPALSQSVSAPIASPVASIQPALDVFERALKHATAHTQPPLSKKELGRAKRAHKASHRLINYSVGALALVLLGGFIAYQNVANITLKVASSKAGFAATLPGYRPAGFAVGAFSYSPGSVAISFHSNTDSRHFAVVEKPSNWDSSTLVNDFVASAGGNSYQTIVAAGRTVYEYGQSNATWVNNGIWYVIHGDNSLSDRQLANVAASM